MSNNLEKLNCENNKLTSLNLNNCAKLKKLSCYDNNLSQTLSIFSQFKNLEYLYISNNPFSGSLEPLKDLKLKRLNISDTDINSGIEFLPDSLEHIQYKTEDRPNCKLSQIQDQLDEKYWVDIHKDFIGNNGKIQYKKDWLAQGFTKEQTKQWIEVGAKPDGLKFLNWFLNFKKLDLPWALENEEEFVELRDNYEYFGTCEECQQPNTSENWCQSCNAKHFKQDFNNWTSGNSQIDNFIQKCQLEATSPWNVLEWIPYEQFTNVEKAKELQTFSSKLQTLQSKQEKLSKSILKLFKKDKINQVEQEIVDCSSQIERLKQEIQEIEKTKIEHIANGGFGKVEKAEWKEGSIEKWNSWDKNWTRSKDYKKNYKTVALKTLTNSQNLNSDFLTELTLYKAFKSEVSNMVPCYGVSKDREGNYIMVMEFMTEGNLRDYLKKNYQELDFKDYEYNPTYPKLHFLKQISQGLKDIHRKNLVHQDFHSGNIVVENKSHCHITDLGLCKPVNETDNSKVFGVMPYMAPEVLRGKPYTQASDIYSFGIIMYEILTCSPPFAEQSHDVNLALQICKGIRPQFPPQVKYPQLLEDLIKKCWDSEPNKRPTARKISKIVSDWYEYGYFKKDTIFYQQYEEAEKHNQTLPQETQYPTYQDNNIWHSKLINTKQITELLQKTSEQFNSSLYRDSELLDLDFPEDPQEQSSHQAQIEIPPKNN